MRVTEAISNLFQNRKSGLLVVLILVIGLIALLILIKNPQIFKSRANQRLYNAIEVTNSQGQLLCNGNGCNTDSLDVNIRLNIEEIERIRNKQAQ